MSRNMFEKFNSTATQYPPNYNGTKEEIVTIDGKKYLKKVHVIKKSDDNLNVLLNMIFEHISDKNI